MNTQTQESKGHSDRTQGAIAALMVSILVLNHVVGIISLALAWSALHEIAELRSDHIKLWARVYSEKVAGLGSVVNTLGGAAVAVQESATSHSRSAAIAGDARGDTRLG